MTSILKQITLGRKAYDLFRELSRTGIAGPLARRIVAEVADEDWFKSLSELERKFIELTVIPRLLKTLWKMIGD